MISARLRETLAVAAAAMAGARGDWWIIGSAAVALHGAEVDAADVDVLAEPEDAMRALDLLGVAARHDGGDALFRSAVFGRAFSAPLPIEIMAGLAVRGEIVRPATRMLAACGDLALPVPDRLALGALLTRFGRAKDLARARLLSPSN